ncbi:RdRP-domain-containing protein [Glonium stellatum]|uniref:RNA-dependent RNA polymerase n=1 Tax=Glonium stellatum TaxID=574774 RepID=A0A8E2JZW5_9PEZI|nr:RdRP-domain-containing protein [Glonium stellatum]
MEIYLHGISPSCTKKDLEAFLKPQLQRHNIHIYYLQKMKRKGCATITVADRQQAEAFLRFHGRQDSFHAAPPISPLTFQGRGLTFNRSKFPPKEIDLRAIEYEENKRIQKTQMATDKSHFTEKFARRFGTTTTDCGYWGYNDLQLVYIPEYHDNRHGELIFGKTAATMLLEPSSIFGSHCRFDVPYNAIETIVLGVYSNPTVTLTLHRAPKFYKIEDIIDSFNAFAFNTHSQRRAERVRTTSMNPDHTGIVGSCFVYQITLAEGSEISSVYQLLEKSPGMPPHISMETPNVQGPPLFRTHLDLLLEALKDTGEFASIPFSVKFQMQRLVTNGFLPPRTVILLLLHLSTLISRHGPPAVSECIRRLANSIEFAGPGASGKQFEVDRLRDSLESFLEVYHSEGSIYDLVKKHQYLTLVHHVTITPCGIYLDGPEPEVSNRVLRQYEEFADHFIRVKFADEDGDRLSYHPRTSNDEIYRERFKSVLRSGFNIVGKQYHFLGFSHSSLRNQTCWFCAPFAYHGKLIKGRDIISQLGDFKQIRSPAKCAARIGQAFSDTSGTVKICEQNLGAMKDVERNGRNFSDGCGTISSALLRRVWDDWAPSKALKPTLLQIRFQGAKGMLSLDSRLLGEKIFLRPSMLKFPGSPSWDIEMCAANFKSLPMYLNRPFIKILEDLQVPANAFLRLQRQRVEELRLMVANPPNASKLLELNRVGSASNLPSLIRLLDDIGISFQEDDFLSSVVEIAALSQLRELKYRARILLDDGVTLLGIMDETGYLKEGEIYCVTVNRKGGRRVIIRHRVIITRSPALHPGDVQLVKAVDVPPDSPLAMLNNCVVFSQHGSRDLPSQLSGGDLDGDSYNVIWDNQLIIKIVHEPADYPRVSPVDIGREVTIDDMSDFFVTFMETDQLGRISTLHQALADRHQEGTMHTDCIKLAGLASTAVDFSKTGIPIDVKQIPRYDRARPDFMAPGPRVLIEDEAAIFEEEADDDEEDAVGALDPDAEKIRYYRSNKVLGQLFRAIDERAFLEGIQGQARDYARFRTDVLKRVFEYVKNEAFLVQWEHYRLEAREIRETYEFNLENSMYSSSPNPSEPVSEVEVFGGSILGKTPGAQSKRIRECTMAMKEEFDRHVAHTVDAITTDSSGSKDDALARSIACLAVGVEEEGKYVQKVGRLKSWKYIAATLCLIELQKFSGSSLLRRIPNVASP